MRAYHRTDPIMDERKSHYTPAQLGAFVKVQLVAGRQTRRGRFRSVAALKAALPAAYAKHVAFLEEQEDIIPSTRHEPCKQCPPGPIPRGEVYVDGWDEWQEGDLTVHERMRRLRNRKRNSDRNAAVTEAVSQPSPTAIQGVGVGIGIGSPPSGGERAREIDRIELGVRALLNGGGTDRQIETVQGLAEQIGDERRVLSVLDEWRDQPVRDRYGGAMGELRDMADRRKRGRGSKAIGTTTRYDDLIVVSE